jgi:2'-5' RNA ligase
MRLFVAIDFPGIIKDQLVRLQTDIPTARWSKPHQMHLTLFFIGETERVPAVKEALAEVESPSFRLTLTGTGRFPKDGRQPPRVLWAGIQLHPALMALQKQVTTALTGIGFIAEDRPYSPHVTLARLQTERPLRQVDAFLSEHRAFQTEPLPVTEFVLFSSVLLPEGPRYKREAVYSLKSTASFQTPSGLVE